MASRVPVLICEDFQGREIRLDSETWYLKISEGHPELQGMLDQIERAVSRPDVLTADALHKDRECYYVHHDMCDRRRYLKVCVSFDRDPSAGRIITAYLVSSVPTKEPVLWQR